MLSTFAVVTTSIAISEDCLGTMNAANCWTAMCKVSSESKATIFSLVPTWADNHYNEWNAWAECSKYVHDWPSSRVASEDLTNFMSRNVGSIK